jgi:hypothetical protein
MLASSSCVFDIELGARSKIVAVGMIQGIETRWTARKTNKTNCACKSKYNPSSRSSYFSRRENTHCLGHVVYNRVASTLVDLDNKKPSQGHLKAVIIAVIVLH